MREANYISNELYYFFGKDFSNEAAFKIFESIFTKGLLATRPSGDQIDKFEYVGEDGKAISVHLFQRARICLTDIPYDELLNHTRCYGDFGIGFSRETVLSWCGLPVWYLPNRLDDPSSDLTGRFVSSLRRIHQKIKDDTDLNGSYTRFLNCIKGMHSKQSGEPDFLFEREWKIIAGLQDSARIPFFKDLTKEEKDIALSLNHQKSDLWRRPLQQEEEPLISTFKLFNGIDSTVSAKITSIVLPNQCIYKKMADYIETNPEKFSERVKLKIR